MAQNPTTQTAGLEQIVAMAWRRKWLGITLFALAATAGVTTVRFLPDVYEATATILVERQQVPEEFVRSTVTAEVDRRLHTISQTIMSRSQLAPLIEQFGLYTEMRAEHPIDIVVEQMREDVALDLRRGDTRSRDATTGAFAISYRGRDPRKVAMVANQLASMYIDEDLKMRERQAQGTADFLSRQLEEELLRKLEEQERKVREFKEKYLGELPQQEAANLATLERLNGQLLLNGEKQARVREQISFLERQIPDGAAVTAGLSEPEVIAARIAQLSRELAELRKRFTDKYPDVVAVKREIAELEVQREAALRREPDDASEGSGPTGAAAIGTTGMTLDYAASLRNAQLEIRALQSEEQSLKKAIGAYQERVENTPKREQEFQAIKRDYETTQQVYQSLLERYEEAKLAQQMEHHQKGEQFRMLDPALVPSEPAAPNRPQLFVMVIGLAAALGGGAVFLRDRLDTSFHSPDELRAAYRVPVLATIGRIVTPGDRRRRRFRFALGTVSFAVAIVVIAAASWLVARENAWLAGLLS